VLRQERRGVHRRGSRLQNRVKQGGSTVSDAVTSTGEKRTKEESLQVEIRVTTGNWLGVGNSAAIFTSGGGRLSCCGVFPIRPEVACSNFARFQNNKIFTQAAQWRFTGNLIRRNDRRWDQPAKIAVAKNPNRHQDRQDTHTHFYTNRTATRSAQGVRKCHGRPSAQQQASRDSRLMILTNQNHVSAGFYPWYET
jgi:hypothetical protein